MAISYGSEYVFNSASTSVPRSAAIDSTHFVVVYRDAGNSYYGVAIIGTVATDGSITYGSEYVFNSASTNNIDVTVLDSTHIAISYMDIGNSNYGTAIIGTISNDDEISFGSEYVYRSVETTFNRISTLSSTKFVIAFFGPQSYSNYGNAIIGTVSSGNQISYGTLNEFSGDATTADIKCKTLSSSKFVVCYRKPSGTTYGYCRIGSVSSSTITYGTEVSIISEDTRISDLNVLDSTHFAVAYYRQASTSTGYIKIGVVSDTTITLGDAYSYSSSINFITTTATLSSTEFAVQYGSYGKTKIGTISNDDEISFGSESSASISTVSKPNICALDSTHVVLVFEDTGNSNYGTAVVGATEIILSFAATIDYSYDITATVSPALSLSSTINYDYDLLADTSLNLNISSPIDYNIDYISPITGTSSFSSTIDYDYSIFSLLQNILLSDFVIDYGVDYSADIVGEGSISAVIDYDYDILSPVNTHYSIAPVIDYDIDYVITSEGSADLDAIVDYDYDWGSWYDYPGRINRSYSFINNRNISYSIGNKQDNRNSKAQITSIGFTPTETENMANTIPTLENSKQSRGK